VRRGRVLGMSTTDLTRVPWRVGTHYGIHLYAGDEPIGTMLTPELAAAAVEAHNATVGDGTVKISGEDPEREYEDALAAHSQALAETERTQRLVDRARIAYERHLGG
jgi:hypothetical protein